MSEINRIALIVTVICCTITMFNSKVFCESVIGKDVLKGIISVDVVVDDLNPDVVGNGLAVNQIKTDIEAKLILAGIAIKNRFGYPRLIIHANIYKSGQCGYVYDVSINALEKVYLARNSKISTTGVTWSADFLGHTPHLSTIRNTIKDLVDKFLNDYLSANPKTVK